MTTHNQTWYQHLLKEHSNEGRPWFKNKPTYWCIKQQLCGVQHIIK